MGALVNWVTQRPLSKWAPQINPAPTVSEPQFRPCLPLLCASLSCPPPTRAQSTDVFAQAASVPFLVAILSKTQQHPTRGGTPPLWRPLPPPPIPLSVAAVMGRHIILPITSPRQRSIPVHTGVCLPACHRPTGSPKTDGPQPVTSVCYFFDLRRGLDSAQRLPLPCNLRDGDASRRRRVRFRRVMHLSAKIRH